MSPAPRQFDVIVLGAGAAGLMCAAVLCFACLDCMAKYLGAHLPTMQVVGVRYASAFFIALMFSNPVNRPGLLRTGRPGLQLEPGHCFAIEPMFTLGTEDTEVLEDGWTVATADGSLAAHFEHTIAITEQGPEILTRV